MSRTLRRMQGHPAASGAIAALWAAAMGFVLIGILVVGIWIVSPQGASSMDSALSAAGLVWLAAHLTPVVLDGGLLSVLPTALVLAPLLLIIRSTRWAERNCGLDEQGAAESGQYLRLRASLVLTYAAIACAASFMSTVGGAGAEPMSAAAHGAVVAALGALLSAGRRGSRMSNLLRCVLVGSTALFTAGVALLTLGLAAHASQIDATLSALSAGGGGAFASTLICLLAIPDAAVWAASLLVGPGFELGPANTVTLFGANPGELPLIPLFSAVPTTMSPWAPALLAVPVSIGVLVARCARRGNPDVAGDWPFMGRFVGYLFLGLVAVATFAAWLVGGSLGSGRFQQIGPPAFGVGLAAGAGICLGVVASLATTHVRNRRALSAALSSPEPAAEEPLSAQGSSLLSRLPNIPRPSLPSVTLPSLPSVNLPDLPSVTLPSVGLPGNPFRKVEDPAEAAEDELSTADQP